MIISGCSHRASSLLRCSNPGTISTSRGSQQCISHRRHREYRVHSLASARDAARHPREGLPHSYRTSCKSTSDQAVIPIARQPMALHRMIKNDARAGSIGTINASPTATPSLAYASASQHFDTETHSNTHMLTAATILTLAGGASLIQSNHEIKAEPSLAGFKQKESHHDQIPQESGAETPLATSSFSDMYHLSSNFLHGEMIRVVESPSPKAWIEKTLTNPQKATNFIPSTPRTYDVSVRALKGSRLSMEDEYFVDNDGHFAAVFDGHGGGGVSAYLRDNLYRKIDQKLSKKEAHIIHGKHGPTLSSKIKAIREAFDETDDDVLDKDDLQYQGSTAVAVMVHQDEEQGNRTLISANLGDSRAILSRRGVAVDLTRDHKPNDEKEKARIVAMGESVEWDHYCKVYRVRNLSLSRAVGDRFAKPAVSGDVEIKQFPVNDEGDEFVLMASDGLWDVMSSQDCVDFVNRRLKSIPKHISNEEKIKASYTRRKVMSRLIANEALRRGSGDNVCVVIVWLKDIGEMKVF